MRPKTTLRTTLIKTVYQFSLVIPPGLDPWEVERELVYTGYDPAIVELFWNSPLPEDAVMVGLSVDGPGLLVRTRECLPECCMGILQAPSEEPLTLRLHVEVSVAACQRLRKPVELELQLALSEPFPFGRKAAQKEPVL